MEPRPDRILHIAQSVYWKCAVGGTRYWTDSLEGEGYIHCCTAEQLAGVARRYFTDRADLVLLEIDATSIDRLVVWESLADRTERFPHIYGDIPIESVVSAAPIRIDATGTIERAPSSPERA